MGRAGCDLLFHCTVNIVVLLLVGGIYVSRNLEMLFVTCCCRGWCWGCGVVGFIHLLVFVDPYECVATIV